MIPHKKYPTMFLNASSAFIKWLTGFGIGIAIMLLVIFSLKSIFGDAFAHETQKVSLKESIKAAK